MAAGWKNDYFRYKDFFLNILRIYKSRPDLKSFLEIILSLSTVIVFSLFAIKPTIITIIELNKSIKNKEETVLKLKQKIKNLQSAGIVLQEQASSLPFVYQSVPINPSIETSIGQIQGHAFLTNTRVLGISSSDITLYGPEDKKKSKQVELPQNAGDIPITISATGSYQDLFSYLESLENTRRSIKIDSFSLNSSRSEGGVILVMVITGRLPYLK